jgi:thiol-disulfide isomerase/thioredoxin
MKVRWLSSTILLLVSLAWPLSAQQSSTQDKGQNQAQHKTETAQATDNEDDLRRAIEAAAGSPTEFLKNLEAYLQKYPHSARRAEIERELYKTALEQRDRNRAITYAEKLIAGNPSDVDVLTALVTQLRERRGAGDLAKALSYAEKLVKEIEAIVNAGMRPRRLSQAQWNDRKDKGMASVYLLRGKVQADLNNDSAAQSDFQKSFKLAKLAGAALALGELAEKRREMEQALEHYIQAFVISLVTDEEVDVKQLRRRLGQLYTAKFGSETGLGDRLLQAYDAFAKERVEHYAKLEGPKLNAGITDPMQFRLTKLDGGQVQLGDYRGKVVVVNFWATWCGPCLTEMPLLEKAMEKYKNDHDVVFWALSTDEERADVQPFIKQHKFKLPFAFAESLDELFRINSIPTTIIFNRKGEVAFRQAGFNSREDFVAKLSERIEAAKN